MQSTIRAEAERLLGIAEKLLQGKDLNGCRDFALLAQETEPLLEGSDQILAVVDVLIAADKRINNHPDWYAILQLDSQRNDDEIIKRQYHRLALLLHPDKNKFPLADAAFKLVADAWALFSDKSKKSEYDNKLFAFTKVDLVSDNQNHSIQRDKIPVRRNQNENDTEVQLNIWTACPYCYNLYEYPKMYEACCLRCANCKRAFQAVAIPTENMPPVIKGKEAYYCCWGYFPMGFAIANSETAKTLTIPNWMPQMFPTNAKAWPSPDSLPKDNNNVALAKSGEGFVVPTPTPVAQPKPPQGFAVPIPPVAQPKPPQGFAVPTPPVAQPTPPPPPSAGANVPRKRGRPRKNTMP